MTGPSSGHWLPLLLCHLTSRDSSSSSATEVRTAGSRGVPTHGVWLQLGSDAPLVGAGLVASSHDEPRVVLQRRTESGDEADPVWSNPAPGEPTSLGPQTAGSRGSLGSSGPMDIYGYTQTLMGPHMEGSDPHMEGSGVSNP